MDHRLAHRLFGGLDDRNHGQPRLGLDTALAWTADWYRRHAAGENGARLTREQIDKYMELAAA